VDHDGIDRADRLRPRRQLVEQGDHRLLVGEGYVDAGKSKTPRAVQQQPQFLAVSAGDFDQLIMTMRAERLGGALMHRGRSRMRDRRADQAGEKAAVGWSKRSGGRAHDLVSEWRFGASAADGPRTAVA